MRCSTLLLLVTYVLICSVHEGWSQNVVACEGDQAKLNCDYGRVISVKDAMYGRLDRTTCSYGRPPDQVQNTRCYGRADAVYKECDGKSQCSIMASNNVFGDPCYGTYKYLEVAYVCRLPDVGPQVVHMLACEGDVARLNCGRRGVIHIFSAVYGRQDRTTCSAGRPQSQLQNVYCSTSSEYVERRCNGRRRCTIEASNQVFGDPCYGTYKYLMVAYVCNDRYTG